MALKPDRKYTDGTDISYFMNAISEKGAVAIFSTGGSGAAMDQSAALVVCTGLGTTGLMGTPAGILLCDVVNYDLTRQHVNQYQDEVQAGNKVTLLRHGEITTNMINTSCTPTVGMPVSYITTATLTGAKQSFTNIFLLTSLVLAKIVDSTAERIGTFKSIKDEDGYAKVEINIL